MSHDNTLFDIISGRPRGRYTWLITVKPAPHGLVPGAIARVWSKLAGGAVATRAVRLDGVSPSSDGTATVSLKPLYGRRRFARLSDQQKAAFHPVGGHLFLGSNSVSDYRAFLEGA